MGGTAGAAIVARAVSEYGILGLGWVLFLFAMFYIRVERRRYQDLVIHIIQYFTKVHMAEGKEDVLPFTFGMPGSKGKAGREKRRVGSRFDESNNDG